MSDRGEEPAEPVLLLGERRSAMLQSVLAKRTEAWRQRWSTARDPIHITTVRDERAERDGLLTLRAGRDSDPLLYICAHPEELPVFLGIATASAGAGPADLAHAVADLHVAVLRSLCGDLLEAAAVDDAVIEHVHTRPAGTGKRGSRYWRASVVYGAARPRIHIVMSPTLVERLVPRRPASKTAEPLARRRAAIGNETVRVEAVLGQVELSLRDFVQLAPGDVLVLHRPLSDGGELIAQSGKRVGDVVLGAATGYRAVSLVKQPGASNQ